VVVLWSGRRKVIKFTPNTSMQAVLEVSALSHQARCPHAASIGLFDILQCVSATWMQC
jgi:hypothetical protein